MNASPAGKRRIAAAAEQQQFGSAYSFGGVGGAAGAGGLAGAAGGGGLGFGENPEGFINPVGGRSGGNGGGLLDSYLYRLNSPVATVAAIAVSACLLVITIFAVMFAVVQVSVPTQKRIKCALIVRTRRNTTFP